MTGNFIRNQDDNPIYEQIETTKYKEDRIYPEPVYGGVPIMRVGFRSPVPPRQIGNPDYVHDIRPILWPIHHPFYLIKMEEDACTVMAYVDNLEELLKAWPEATDLTVFDEFVEQYQFSARFPRPEWMDEVNQPGYKAIKRTGAYTITEPNTGLVIVGYSDDVDYDIQLNNHQLEYQTHENKEFLDAYTGWENLQIHIHPASSLQLAKALAEQILAFENDDGEIPTTINQDNW